MCAKAKGSPVGGAGALLLLWVGSWFKSLSVRKSGHVYGVLFFLFWLGANGGGMLRAALGTAFLSAVTNLIEIANPSNCASCRLEYTACWQQ